MDGTFKLKKINKLPKIETGSITAPKLKDADDQPPFFVKGMKAGSKEEYWISLALEKITAETGWWWDYQVEQEGGRARAGGQVVDFLVGTPGRTTALDPMGRYWHTGKNEDRQDMINLSRDRNWNLIQWFTDETPSKDIMYQFLRNKLNV